MPTLPISLAFLFITWIMSTETICLSPSLPYLSTSTSPLHFGRNSLSETHIWLLFPCWSSVLSTFHYLPLPPFLQPHFSGPTVIQTDCIGNSCLGRSADSSFFRHHSAQLFSEDPDVLHPPPSTSRHRLCICSHLFSPSCHSTRGQWRKNFHRQRSCWPACPGPTGTLQSFTNLFMPSELGFWDFKAEIWLYALLCVSSERGNKLSLKPTSLSPRLSHSASQIGEHLRESWGDGKTERWLSLLFLTCPCGRRVLLPRTRMLRGLAEWRRALKSYITPRHCKPLTKSYHTVFAINFGVKGRHVSLLQTLSPLRVHMLFFIPLIGHGTVMFSECLQNTL